ncbi:MAG: hypothetical protein V4607_01820, partial [Pseudomonadota bacterium]
ICNWCRKEESNLRPTDYELVFGKTAAMESTPCNARNSQNQLKKAAEDITMATFWLRTPVVLFA